MVNMIIRVRYILSPRGYCSLYEWVASGVSCRAAEGQLIQKGEEKAEGVEETLFYCKIDLLASSPLLGGHERPHVS
jgi:hypothetical protein